MNFIRAYSHRNREQFARLVTRPERELFRDNGYDENFNEAVDVSTFVQQIYSDESDDVTFEDEFYANQYDLEAQAVMVIDVEAQDIVLTPREDMIDPNFIPDPPQLQRSRNVQPVYVGMEPRRLAFDGPEPLDGWDSDTDSISTVSMTTDEDDLSVSEL